MVKKLSSGNNFYLFDNEFNNENSVIFFKSGSLWNLGCSNIWFVDATFKVVLKQFKQLLIIQTVFSKQKFLLF